MIPAPRPMMMAGIGATKPEAGVIATRPATAPLAAPRTVGLPTHTHSATTHESVAAAAPRLVATKADTARPFAASALPALKPNHPTHSKPAPVTVIVKLLGSIGSRGYPRRRPTISTAARAETPDEM